jgi:hypothetical protein
VRMTCGPASCMSDERTDAPQFFHCPHMWIFPVPPPFLFITFPHECSVVFTAGHRHRFHFPLVPFRPARIEGRQSQVVFPEPCHHQEPCSMLQPRAEALIHAAAVFIHLLKVAAEKEDQQLPARLLLMY